MLAFLAAAAIQSGCVAVVQKLPEGFTPVSEAELPGLLIGRALWDEVKSPPNAYDRAFVIAFGPDGKAILDSGVVKTPATYRFAKGEVCVSGYTGTECFRLYHDRSEALLRNVTLKEGAAFTPVYWMPSATTLPPKRPAVAANCDRPR